MGYPVCVLCLDFSFEQQLHNPNLQELWPSVLQPLLWPQRAAAAVRDGAAGEGVQPLLPPPPVPRGPPQSGRTQRQRQLKVLLRQRRGLSRRRPRRQEQQWRRGRQQQSRFKSAPQQEIAPQRPDVQASITHLDFDCPFSYP